jgi:2-polyprenyl-3-methyl-5-hydroxy-6-metoxy-1,4-benzoquinol methylase
MATPLRTSKSVPSPDDLVEKIFNATLGVWDLFAVYIGDQLGLYQAMADGRPTTSRGLAGVAGLDERYVREWLEQQAVSGILTVESSDGDAASRRFSLPAPYAEVLADPESPNYLVPLAQCAVGAVFPIQAVTDAYRTGQGVSFADYGADLRRGQGRMNRYLFVHQLGTEYFPAIPDLDARLRANPPARIADIGCGVGWSCIGVAQAYPRVSVDGFDLDEASVDEAQQNIADTNLGDRVTVSLSDGAGLALAGQFDLVTAYECIHDMSDPVSVLTSMRRLKKEDGMVIVVDERVGETFDPEHASDVERLLYGFSVLHCLPAGRVETPSTATGTVMRPSTLRKYVQAAGFRDNEILPLENDFFYFYRLVD